MPPVVIERANLPTEMRDALKKHILRERQRKKEEADANEADKQRRREEKVYIAFSCLLKLPYLKCPLVILEDILL